MTRLSTLSFVLLLTLSLLYIPPALAQSPEAGEVEDGLPLISMEEAFDTAANTDKSVFIDVYAPWCPHCQRLEQEVYADNEVQTLMEEHFVMVRINADDPAEEHVFLGETMMAPDLATSLGAHGFPTLIFMTSEGERIGMLPGAVEKSDFMLLLRYVGTGAFRDQSLEAFAGE